jgi:hypothetical protein
LFEQSSFEPKGIQCEPSFVSQGSSQPLPPSGADRPSASSNRAAASAGQFIKKVPAQPAPTADPPNGPVKIFPMTAASQRSTSTAAAGPTQMPGT